MTVERIRALEPGLTAASLRATTIIGAGPRPQVSTTGVRPLDTAAVLRVLIEEVRSVALDRLGFVPAPEREPFPVADRDRAATVLLKIMTAIAGDPRFQPLPDEDPAHLLQDVLRQGTDHALNALARLPVASGAPRALVEATRDAVAALLPDPVRQRAALVRAVHQALVVETENQLGRSPQDVAQTPAAGTLRYDAVAVNGRPTLEALFGELVAQVAEPGARTVARDGPAALWARIETPVRAAFGAGPDVERVLMATRERVFATLVSGLVHAPAEPDDVAAERFLDRVATTLAGAVNRPVSLPAAAPDARGITGAVIDALRQIASTPPANPQHEAPLAVAIDALRGLLLRESPAVAPGAAAGRGTAPHPVVEARALLLRLLGSSETVEAARREPAQVVRWLADMAAALARDHGLPYRLDLAVPRRRLGLKRARTPAAEPDREDPVPAIETFPRRDRSDEPGDGR